MSERARDGSDHEGFRDDLAAYALGALSEPEAALLRDHLQGCEDCRRQLRWLEPAVDLLPGAVTQLEPPPELRERLLETVRADAEASTASRKAPRPRRGWAIAFRPATVLAAGLLLAAGGVVGYLVAHGSDEGGSSRVTVQAENGDSVRGTLEARDGSGILRLEGMPRLARGDVYEVWVQRDGVMTPSSLFEPRRDRSASAAIPGGLDGAKAVLVTPEPRGGSPQPTSPPVLQAPLD